MDKNLECLLKIAALLIEAGEATPENAFILAIELQNRHIEGMLKALYASNAPDGQELTGYNEVYMGVIEEISERVYFKINT